LIDYSDEGANYDYRVDAKHVYQEAAVYFSLLTELKHMDRPQDVSPLTRGHRHLLKFMLNIILNGNKDAEVVILRIVALRKQNGITN
jgi:hypothetical protein